VEKRASYWELFTSMFYLSAFTFGGGYVIVPLMEDKFVKELGWIDYDEMLDLIALGQSAPGAIAVNTSVLIGYQRLGVLGAVVSTLGTVLPPLLIMTGLSYIYLLVRDNPYVNNMLLGMSAGVAAIIVNVVYKMARRIIDQQKLVPILVMIGAFILVVGFHVHILWILFGAGLIGLITTVKEGDSV